MPPNVPNSKPARKLPWSTIWSGLFLLPSFVFWLSLQIGFDGGGLRLLRLWRILPDFFYPYLILFLPLPAIVLGVLSLFRLEKKNPAAVVGGVLFTALGIVFLVYAMGKTFFPPQ